MRFQFRLWLLIWCVLGCTGARPVVAHPMGNFSINHYARFEAKSQFLSLRTVLDFAEIPTSERMPQLDSNDDGTIGEAEKRVFLQNEIASNARGYSVEINGRKADLKLQSSHLDVRPGAGGLQTLRVIANWKIALPASRRNRVAFVDSNFEGRNGWMEIIATGTRSGAVSRSGGPAIADSNAASIDRSRELTVFPVESGTVAPRQRQANFSVVSSGAIKTPPIANSNAPISTENGPVENAPNTQTPQNRFTQSIAEKQLTPGLILGGLLAALAFGAVHALSPGHGKTMVAAYLVGSRGTPRHAILLGIVVTVTHTLGVFALGIALLFASRYVLPERLFPILSALSGLLIFGVGLWLFMNRYQELSKNHEHNHNEHDHHHNREHSHEHSHDENGEHSHGEHSHGEHSHGEHSHGDQVHSHGGRAHSHAVPDGPITLKTLVALGISGGIVPCPEALVVLLAAVKLHRIGYGMLLITAFSIGLAAALIAIGLVVVSARQRFGASSRAMNAPLMRYLPLGSAAAVTIIGIVLTLQATIGGP